MKETLQFSVMGENDDIYEVAIERALENTANLTALCSCGDAQHGNFCSHRYEIFEGDISNLVSDNLKDVQTLRDWIKGSDIEAAMQELSKAKTELKMAREKVAHCRKILARRMMD
ncbi:MAG: hypothetical protein ACX939_06105 [Hyphococcus sp.]